MSRWYTPALNGVPDAFSSDGSLDSRRSKWTAPPAVTMSTLHQSRVDSPVMSLSARLRQLRQIVFKESTPCNISNPSLNTNVDNRGVSVTAVCSDTSPTPTLSPLECELLQLKVPMPYCTFDQFVSCMVEELGIDIPRECWEAVLSAPTVLPENRVPVSMRKISEINLVRTLQRFSFDYIEEPQRIRHLSVAQHAYLILACRFVFKHWECYPWVEGDVIRIPLTEWMRFKEVLFSPLFERNSTISADPIL